MDALIQMESEHVEKPGTGMKCQAPQVSPSENTLKYSVIFSRHVRQHGTEGSRVSVKFLY
jgi:hypothetical protein